MHDRSILSDITILTHLIEPALIRELEQALESDNQQPCLVGSNNAMIPLPKPIYQALRQVVRAMAAGKPIVLALSDRELSSQEAADILNVSPTYLVEHLLKSGEIPHIKSGSRHLIKFQDVIFYKQKQDQKRYQSLTELTELLQDEGCYDA